MKKNGTLWAKGRCIPTDNPAIPLTQVGNVNDWDQTTAAVYSAVRKDDGSVWMLRKGEQKGVIKTVRVLEMGVFLNGTRNLQMKSEKVRKIINICYFKKR